MLRDVRIDQIAMVGYRQIFNFDHQSLHRAVSIGFDGDKVRTKELLFQRKRL
jgi:hypothetical protein